VKPTEQENLDKLLKDGPKFHASYTDGIVTRKEIFNWGLQRDILEWLIRNIDQNSKTLETGCGYSTVAFSIVGADHLAISPFKEEHDAITNWCMRNGIDTERTRFLAASSEEVIYDQGRDPLDLVLIDGDHAFPVPFVDWLYTADRLTKGGYVVVDDTQLITGTILERFLSMEKGRWELHERIGKTTIFKKQCDESVLKGIWFGLQPFCAQRRRSIIRRIRRKVGSWILHPDDVIFWD
jgi:predicted O-methyltransferase YrrM